MATEILRPDQPGTETAIWAQVPDTGAHWDKVDEVEPDGTTTYLKENATSYRRDLFTIPDTSPKGPITSIIIYFRTANGSAKAKPSLRTHSVTYDGTEITIAGPFTTYNETWNTNPNTGQPWTWQEINALEIGISLKNDASSHPFCTQVYVLITHTTVLPTVQTNDADNIDHESAKLHGTLTDDGGMTCDVRFQYGKTVSYGTDTEWQSGKVSEDTFEQIITGLDPEETYHFRAQAKNSEGTSSGSDKQFQTTAAPPAQGAVRKAQITHPALKTVRILQFGQQVAKFDHLSNPDQQYIESGLTVSIPTPSTVEVTTLAGQTWEFNIPEK